MKRFIIIFLILVLQPVNPTIAFNLPEHSFPRLVNLYWKTPIDENEAKQLARWDIVALDMQAQTESAEMIKYLRKINPKIIILAYTSANEIPVERLKIMEPGGHGLWHDLISGIKPQWQLKTFAGQNISWWPGNISMNLYAADETGRTYADYLADFYQSKVLATGLWDGLLFDNTWQNVSWVDNKIDIDADGRADSTEKIDRLWREGHFNLFKNLRNKFGDRYLIIGNGDGQYHEYLNGRMFEGFPEFYEGGWSGSMERYAAVTANGYQPRLNLINADTDNTGHWQNYQKMRYGLTSSLLYDAYFSFDYGTQLREQLWWYDEYEINLGQPKNEPFNLFNQNDKKILPGVWQRDFAYGAVLVNSTDQTQKLNFNEEYEKIHGTQDINVNSGAIINQLTLEPEDGIILLRPITEIANQIFTNGSFARIFNQQGQNIRTGFFAYDPNFRGSQKIIKIDINNSQQKKTVVANDQRIDIYDENHKLIRSFYPYGEKYNLGISLAVADLNGDGQMEIVTGSERGHANLVKIFSWQGEIIHAGFHAYHANWKNLGVNVAVGDVTGDGQMEIVTGAGFGGGPHVRIFDQSGKLKLIGFFAYDPNFRGGVNVAVGDVTGNGVAEIITGPGFGGGPHVRIFDRKGRLYKEWFAYQPQSREGVKVAAADLDHDGRAEIIALTTNVFTTTLLPSNNQLEYASRK